ncbi:MAG TPA: hypothetical protein VF648_03115 [Pyrinomonadaceae bacterium]
MLRLPHYLFAFPIVLLICFTSFAYFYYPPIQTEFASAKSEIQTNQSNNQKASAGEVLLSETENAYNPIPNKDGSLIAYVRTGWGRPGGSGGFGRSNLVTDVSVMDSNGRILTKQPLADAFLQGWTPDGKHLICARDWRYSIFSTDGTILTSERLPDDSDSTEVSERVAFLSTINSVIWLQNNYTNIKRTKTAPGSEYMTRDFVRSVIQSPKGEIAKYNSRLNPDGILIPSPNERYLALIGRNNLEIYDRQNETWTNLGKVIIHPSDDWDYIKPMWNPWFGDSSRLALLTASGIIIISPDGKTKQTIFKPKQASGLPVPSPDGKFIAFATFEPRAMKIRKDLKFWGGSTIWVVPVVANSVARSITKKNEDTTFSLNWLNNHTLVFDRIAEDVFYKKARIWKVEISQ